MSDSFSFSKIETYDNCKFKYKLKYVDNNYFSAESISLSYGSLVHKIEELIAIYIMDNKPIDYTDLINKFINGMDDKGKHIKGIKELSEKFKDDYYSPDKSGKTYDEKSNYYLTEGIYRLERLMKANPGYQLIGAELDFKFENEIGNFKGVIDRIIYDSYTNTIIIQDIKTYSEPMGSDKLSVPLQMVIYTMAAKIGMKLTNQNIVCQYDLPLLNMIQTVTNKKYMESGVKKLHKLFKEINEGDFTPNPTRLCHWCDFCPTNKNAPEKGKYLCPYFCVWTKENKNLNVANSWLGLEFHNVILNNYHNAIKINNNKEGGEMNGSN